MNTPSTARPPGRRWLVLVFCCVVCGGVAAGSCASGRPPAAAAMSDAEFWTLMQSVSEPPGTFPVSDNLVSNEPAVAENARRLTATGGVYIGVGPEQNFTYIARMRPSLAFIVDIRRENLALHLFYKALFELSADRADFVARLFSRARPGGIGAESSVAEIFERFDPIVPSAEQMRWNAKLVRDRLVDSHGFALSQADLEWIERIFQAFSADGPAIQFWRAAEGEPAGPSFRQLMTARDAGGQYRSFLATEAGFQFLKELQARNLIVPVVGDFGGPSALRRIGDYVRTRGAAVRAFYGSNVAVYLTTRQTHAFCRSLAALPGARDAWFIERDGVRTVTSKLRDCAYGR